MIEKLDQKENTAEIRVEPNEGEFTFLSSNKSSLDSPFLDFNPNSPLIPEEVLVDQLAAILVEGLLARESDE